MIDMRLTPQQAPQATLLASDAETGEGPQYPYGLRITLNGQVLKRLAIGSGNLPAVGAQMQLRALVEVVAVSQESRQIEDSRTIELQITALELAPPDAPLPNAEAAAKLYG